MAALLRHGAAVARRLGGSMVQRAEAAVAEQRRRLGPRLVHTDEQAHDKIAREIQQKKEELYDAAAKAQQSFWTRSWANKRLLRHLSAEVKARPSDSVWRWLQFSRRANGVLRIAGFVSLTGVVTSASQSCKKIVEDKKVAWAMNKEMNKKRAEEARAV